METQLENFPSLTTDLWKSAVLLAVILGLRFLLVRWVRKRKGLSPEGRTRRLVLIRNSLFTAFVVGLFLLWATELKTFAVTLVAVAVALVLATKELILCLSGAVLRGVTDAYEPGDRIQIGEIRGRVLDQNLLATRVMEIGPGRHAHQYTGRTVVIPNSLLISGPIFNETNAGKFVIHILKVPAPQGIQWEAAEKLLLEAANIECRPFLEDARRSFKKLESKGWLDTPSVEPRVSLRVLENRRIIFLLRIPAPVKQPWRLEQVILRRYLSDLSNRKETNEMPSPAFPPSADHPPSARPRRASGLNHPRHDRGKPEKT